MSFAAKIDGGRFEYAGTNLSTVFAQLKNALNPKFWLMLSNIVTFNKKAKDVLEKPFEASYSLGHFLDDLGMGDYFRKFYLLPMSGAIWSCPIEVMLAYPAQSFVRFFQNHGLLSVSNQPQWYTVNGGSVEYVKKIAAKLSDSVSLNDEVISVVRLADGILVKSAKGEEVFDSVLFATHGDLVLKIMSNPNQEERRIFSNFSYQKNLAVLHRDSSLMPVAKRAWASWVYSKNEKESNQISVTYWMNNLQNIDKNFPLFVTLNPNEKIAEDKVFARFVYDHPIFDSKAVAAQSEIKKVQGLDRIYFCGAYQKYGFHEDGISSAIAAMNLLDVWAPWQK
jgi:predicted NAD/FAD-binding protein